MKDLIKEAEAMVNCRTCKWNRFCLKPPTMTRHDIEKSVREMEEGARKIADSPEDIGSAMIMKMIMFLGKDTACPACLGLVRRMEDPVLSYKIKELMQNSDEALPECKLCGWEKFCLQPPIITEEEQKAKIEQLENHEDPEKSFMGSLVGTVLLGGRATECPACSVFIQKLRKSSELAQQIKQIMQSWEEEEPKPIVP